MMPAKKVLPTSEHYFLVFFKSEKMFEYVHINYRGWSKAISSEYEKMNLKMNETVVINECEARYCGKGIYVVLYVNK